MKAADDISGSGNHGTISGAIRDNGKLGSALRFNGINNFVNCDDVLDLGTSDFTLSAWFWIDSLPGAWKKIFGKGDSGTPGYGLEISSVNKYVISIQSISGTNYHLSSSGSVTTSSWHHLVGVYDRDIRMDMFVDGLKIATDTSNILKNIYSIDNSYSFRIGAHGVTTWNFKGLIDEVMIYNRALTSSEVQNIYNSGNGRVITVSEESGLIGYWRFEFTDAKPIISCARGESPIILSKYESIITNSQNNKIITNSQNNKIITNSQNNKINIPYTKQA